MFLKGEPTARMKLISAIQDVKSITEIKKLIKSYGDEMWWKGWDSAITNDPPSENSEQFHEETCR